jgi:cytochrome P450/NADPH-cytochrome P450 reductase
VKVTVDRPEMLGEKEMTLGTVRQHFQVADTSVGPRKMMMDVELPGDVTYQAGDYLVVLPTNHRHNVRRVLQRFDMPVDALVKLSGTKKSFLVRRFLLPTSWSVCLANRRSLTTVPNTHSASLLHT